MSAIRGILFDKDGTLVDFEATWTAVAERLALVASNGDAAEAARLLDLGGFDAESRSFRANSVIASGTNADVVALWYPELTREERTARTAEFDAVTAEEGARAAVPVAGIAEAIAKLRDTGYRLGLATNDSTRGAEQTLLALGLAHSFDAIYGYDAVAVPKPAPDVLHAFADMTGLKPAQLAMVGDNRHDLETGRAGGAGLVVGVLSGTGTAETLKQLADVVIGSVADLPALLEGRAA